MNDNEELAQRRKDKEIERHKDLISKLKEEHKTQETNHKLVIARLEAEKDVWFASTNSTKVDAIMQARHARFAYFQNKMKISFDNTNVYRIYNITRSC